MNTIWILIIIGMAYFVIRSIDKRIKRLEEVRGPGDSQWFSINALDSVIKHHKFGDITGIKSASEGKEYKNWTKTDKDKWFKKWAKDVSHKSGVTIYYLPGENAYLVRTSEGNPYLVVRTYGTQYLYSAIIVGDKDGFKDHIELLIYERVIKNAARKFEFVLTACLRYSDGKIPSDKHDFKILFDYPLFAEKTKEDLEKLGFEVERRGGDDVYENSFGETEGVPTEITYKKNGAEIRYVY